MKHARPYMVCHARRTMTIITFSFCVLLNRTIKREEEKSLENSLIEAIADSSLDSPVVSKSGEDFSTHTLIFYVNMGYITYV